MQTRDGSHIHEDHLEQYALGVLREGVCQTLEEHLLICADCQERLEEVDEYIRAAKSALKLRTRKRWNWMPDSSWREWMPRPAMAMVLAAFALVVLLPVFRQQVIRGPVEVDLKVSRGADDGLVSRAPAGRGLALKLDATGLPALPTYRIELVTADGVERWNGSVAPHDKEILATIPRGGFSQGKYWVRLYDANDRSAPLREYGLELK